MANAMTSTRLLITRSFEQAQPFVELLSHTSLAPVEVDCAPIRQAVAHTPDSELMSRLPHGGFSWALISSANAVLSLKKYAVESQRTLPQLLATTKVAAVGASTAQVLADNGVVVDYIPSVMDAEHLGQELPYDDDQPVLCVLGKTSRPTLNHVLASRNIPTETVILYDMEPYPATNPLTPLRAPEKSFALGQVRERWQEYAGVIATAPSLLEELVTYIYGEESPVSFPPLIAMGRTTASHAQRLGLDVYIAPAPTPGGLCEAVHHYFL
ncbi:uroporphyrinogen-III synthase [Rothia sp. P7181]|uniref:uroporphyrinogen-III synthase n=1 Tax=Rothia sp. P7181 TaxID=3402663 RepID=UPI003AEC0A06